MEISFPEDFIMRRSVRKAAWLAKRRIKLMFSTLLKSGPSKFTQSERRKRSSTGRHRKTTSRRAPNFSTKAPRTVLRYGPTKYKSTWDSSSSNSATLPHKLEFFCLTPQLSYETEPDLETAPELQDQPPTGYSPPMFVLPTPQSPSENLPIIVSVYSCPLTPTTDQSSQSAASTSPPQTLLTFPSTFSTCRSENDSSSPPSPTRSTTPSLSDPSASTVCRSPKSSSSFSKSLTIQSASSVNLPPEIGDYPTISMTFPSLNGSNPPPNSDVSPTLSLSDSSASTVCRPPKSLISFSKPSKIQSNSSATLPLKFPDYPTTSMTFPSLHENRSPPLYPTTISPNPSPSDPSASTVCRPPKSSSSFSKPSKIKSASSVTLPRKSRDYPTASMTFTSLHKNSSPPPNPTINPTPSLSDQSKSIICRPPKSSVPVSEPSNILPAPPVNQPPQVQDFPTASPNDHLAHEKDLPPIPPMSPEASLSHQSASSIDPSPKPPKSQKIKSKRANDNQSKSKKVPKLLIKKPRTSPTSRSEQTWVTVLRTPSPTSDTEPSTTSTIASSTSPRRSRPKTQRSSPVTAPSCSTNNEVSGANSQNITREALPSEEEALEQLKDLQAISRISRRYGTPCATCCHETVERNQKPSSGLPQNDTVTSSDSSTPVPQTIKSSSAISAEPPGPATSVSGPPSTVNRSDFSSIFSNSSVMVTGPSYFVCNSSLTQHGPLFMSSLSSQEETEVRRALPAHSQSQNTISIPIQLLSTLTPPPPPPPPIRPRTIPYPPVPPAVPLPIPQPPPAHYEPYNPCYELQHGIHNIIPPTPAPTHWLNPMHPGSGTGRPPFRARRPYQRRQ